MTRNDGMTLVAVPLLDGLGARPRGTRPVRLCGTALGTDWSVSAHLPAGCAPAAVQAVIAQELAAVTAEMSGWEPGSELCRFNRGAAGSWHPVSAGHFTVVQAALRIAAATDGAFDPCLGARVARWGFGPSGAVGIPPSPAPAARPCPDWQLVQTDPVRQAVRQPGGITLDLSAIGKGHAVDRVCLALQGLGLSSLLVEIGGELRGEGVKPDGAPWWVAVEAPAGVQAAGGRRAVVALHGQAIATSGDYRRYFDHAGSRFGHVLDPRTGAPAETDLAAATVLCRDCLQADAYATALASRTADDALALAERLGLAALLRLRDGTARFSTAFAAML